MTKLVNYYPKYRIPFSPESELPEGKFEHRGSIRKKWIFSEPSPPEVSGFSEEEDDAGLPLPTPLFPDRRDRTLKISS